MKAALEVMIEGVRIGDELWCFSEVAANIYLCDINFKPFSLIQTTLEAPFIHFGNFCYKFLGYLSCFAVQCN